MPQAVELIRQELGPDAVILSTHKVRAQGLGGLFGRMVYEVIAAIDEDKQGQPSSSFAPRPRQRPFAASEKPAQDPPMAAASEPQPPVVQQQVAVAVQEPKIRRWEPETVITRNSAQAGSANAEIAGKPQVDEGTAAAAQASAQAETSAGPASLASDPVVTELKELRSILTHFVIEGKDIAGNLDLKKLLSLWTGTGLSQALAEKFVARVQAMQTKGVFVGNFLPEIARSFISDALKAAGPARLIRPEDRFVALIGPTGVGKTTTIAKLAAHAKLKEDRAVGLLTVDTFRVAAVEQLRTYADILNIPIAVAESPSEVETALENLKECDLVLVDTTGRNFLDMQQVQELKMFLEQVPLDLTYLVLSLTARATEAVKIAELLQPLSAQGLLFTKADEAILPALALTMVDQLQLPLSYISGGQHVPSDLFIADTLWFLEKFSGGEAGA